jgi:hypothetical protein
MVVAAAAAAAALAAGCVDRRTGEPRPTSIEPANGPPDVAVAVVIRGESFAPRVTTNFQAAGRSEIDSRYTAALGSMALENVTLHEDGTLSAVVPVGSEVGRYDLTVTDPWGRSGTLADAYQVVAPSQLQDLVASYRIAPIPPQRVSDPFLITVTAVDAAGGTVTSFNRTVSLTDLTGTVVPSTVGSFAMGTWSGPVEVRVPHAANVLRVRDAAGKTGDSPPFAVQPREPAALAFTTGSATVRAGACSPEVAVALLDDLGQVATAAGPVQVTLGSSHLVRFQLFADTACTSPIATLTIPAGGSSAGFHFRAERAGPVSIRASAFGLAPGSQLHTVRPGPPAAFVVDSPPQVVNAGACSEPLAFHLEDAFGNLAPAEAPLSASLTATPGAGFFFFSDAACAAASVSSASFEVGQSSAAMRFVGTAAGVVTVRIDGSGLAPASQDQTITPQGAATRLAFVTPPRTAQAGKCSELVSIQTQDSFGNPVPAAGDRIVTLADAPAGALAFFTDPACTAATGTVTVVDGTSTQALYFRGQIAQPVTITASSSGLSPASQVQTVTGGDAAALSFISAPQTVPAGQCSSGATVQVLDGFGNQTTVRMVTQVDLASGPPGRLLFHDNPACSGAAVTSVTMSAGTGQVTFWFTGTVAGAADVTAGAAGLTPATQTEQIAGAAAARLAFTTAPQTVPAGQCSGVVTVEAQDVFGNPSTQGTALPLALTSDAASGFAFFSDPACSAAVTAATIPAGGSAATFHFAGTAAGPVNITADDAGALAAATQREEIVPGAPSRVVFQTPPVTLQAGSCSPEVRVLAHDAHGNPADAPPGTVVSLGAAPSHRVTFYSDPLCTAAITSVTLPAGAGGAAPFHFAALTAGMVPLTADVPGWQSASQTETVTAGPVGRVAFISPAQTIPVNACSGAAVVQSQDAHGNVSAVGAPLDLALSSDRGAAVTFHADSSCATAPVTQRTIPAGQTTATFHFRSTVTGPLLLTATPPPPVSAGAQAQTITTSGAPTRLEFLTPPRSVVAGTCSAVATVITRDSVGNEAPVASGTAVTLSAPSGSTVVFHSNSSCSAPVSAVTIPATQSRASFYFTATRAQTVTATAASGGLTAATQDETVLAAPPDRLAFTTGTQTASAGSCFANATVQAQDPFGNPSAPMADTAVALSPSLSQVSFFSDACATALTAPRILAGQTTMSFRFRALTAGALTLTATAGSWAPGTRDYTVNPAPADRFVIEGSPQTVVAGTCSGPTVVATYDQYGNPSPTGSVTPNLNASPNPGGNTFRMYTASDCSGTPITSINIPNNAIRRTFHFSGTQATTVTITASRSGWTSGSQDEVIDPAAPSRLRLVGPAPMTVAAGSCSGGDLVVEAQDAFGNPVRAPAPIAVTLSTTQSGVTFYTDTACATAGSVENIPAGGAQATFRFSPTTRPPAPYLFTVNATASTWPAAQQDHRIDPGPLDHFSWTIPSGPRTLNTPFSVTVTAYDFWNNLKDNFTGTATISITPGSTTVTCTSGCSSGNVTVPFSGGIWSAGMVSVGPPPGTNRRLVATSGSSTGQSDPFEVVPAPTGTPPTALFNITSTATPTGSGSITFDATPAFDYQTPKASLQYSWDFSGTATAAPGTAPWTAWDLNEVRSHTYSSSGVYFPRLAVMDGDGMIGITTRMVRPLGGGDSWCIVDSNADTDNGQGCNSPPNTLTKAVRISNNTNGRQIIGFSGPMTISGGSTLNFTAPADIVAPTGVILFQKDIHFSGGGTYVLANLEISSNSNRMTVNGSLIGIYDSSLHDHAGFDLNGPVTLIRTSVLRCTGDCFSINNASAQVTAHHSEFRDVPTNRVPLFVNSCNSGQLIVDLFSNVFARNGTAVQANCPGTMRIRNNTFHGNVRGVVYSGGTGHDLRNNAFTSQTNSAVDCAGGPTFSPARSHHLLFGNNSDGCVGPDSTGVVRADPLYIRPAAPDNDFRISDNSPARDVGLDLGLDVNGPASGNFFGPAPDLGGRETW